MATVYETAVLASTSYEGPRPGPVPPGWKLLPTNDGKPLTRVDAKSGFEAAAYRNEVTGEIVVSYVGTNDRRDVFGTFPEIVSGSMPVAQFKPAVEFLNEVLGIVRNQYPGASVVLTGHSLGGLLAQAVSVVERSLTGHAIPTATFEAPGARSAIEKWLHESIDGLTSQITNYVHPSDQIGTFRDHAGEVRYWGGIEGPGVGEAPWWVQIVAAPLLAIGFVPSIFLNHKIPNAVDWFRDDPEGQRVLPGSAPQPQGSSESIPGVGVPFRVNSESSTAASGVVTNMTINWFDTLSAPPELGFVAPPPPPPVPAPPGPALVELSPPPPAPDVRPSDPSGPLPDPTPLPQPPPPAPVVQPPAPDVPPPDPNPLPQPPAPAPVVAPPAPDVPPSDPSMPLPDPNPLPQPPVPAPVAPPPAPDVPPPDDIFFPDPTPVFLPPPPIYVPPPPVYVPPPIFYEPPPIFYEPPSFFGGGGFDFFGGGGFDFFGGFFGGDPVVLDLNHDGVLLQPAAKDGVVFDLNGDGFVERTAWVQPEDGLLALDRDHDGKITSGRELFSEFFDPNQATTGLGALGLFDANHDGVIDTKDPVFGQLQVWRDANHDGRTDPGELRTLDQLGITSIQLAGVPANEPVDGGRIMTRTTFIQNGMAKDAADVFFATDGGSIRSAGSVDLNRETINLAADGHEVDDTRVAQLRQAMAAFAPSESAADMTLSSDLQHQLTPVLAGASQSGHGHS